jgi:hypothetical protein
MLQEEQTVAFQPMYDVFVPWYIRLFHLYLALVVLLTVLRSAHLIWTLRTPETAVHRSETFTHVRSQDFWEHSYVKAQSLKTLSHLTFLISITALLWSLADDLTQVATQKTAGIGAIAGALADTLRTFSAGIVISTALFCVAVLCERLIRRRKLGVSRERGKEVLP